MADTLPSDQFERVQDRTNGKNLLVLLVSITLQITLGLFFGHVYDMRIFLATGYLVGNGQNPYVAQDLSSVFNNPYFRSISSVGYFPPWPLLLGAIYRTVYSTIPNILFYNLAIKLPVIAANIYLAYLVKKILITMGVDTAVSRRAWVFLLLNPFLLYFDTAWGQFDSIVAMLSLCALFLLYRKNIIISALTLALAISFKPTGLPILLVACVYLMGISPKQVLVYSAMFFISITLFCYVPFIAFGWNPAPILQNWNAHFTVAGGMSWFTFFELWKDTYQLPGQWWLVSLAWIPALGITLLGVKSGIHDFVDLLKKSMAFILVFFLVRTWLSEPNITLILPLALILYSLDELPSPAFLAIWLLPMIFTFFNASLPQVFFPSMPGIMEQMLQWMDHFRTARLVIRTFLVIPWQIAGWWIVVICLHRFEDSPNRQPSNKFCY